MINLVSDINTICSFLSRRDISTLSTNELYQKFGIPQVDIVVILGNSIPYIASVGLEIYKSGLAKQLMIAGGIGHATKYLVENIRGSKEYENIDVENMPEADILKQFILQSENITEENIIIENHSTNCGSNAFESLKVLKNQHNLPGSILLLQDPLMQLRSHLSFMKEWEKERTSIISYAPFVPQLVALKDKLIFVNDHIQGLWSHDRFIDLIMGEIPRLRDDEHGYGPNGKGYIAHIDIPDDILYSFNHLLSHYSEYGQIKNRK